jgi:hypothetical protein
VRNYAPPHKYTAAETRFLRSYVAGRSYAELTEMFNRRFGLSFAVKRIVSALGRLKLTNGRDCRFRPGHTPYNKGKKGYCPAGCEKGWFRPGNRPWTHKPVGTCRVNRDGNVEVRIRNPSGNSRKNWKPKHRLIWEKAHGKVPRGHVVIFADGDKSNFALDNLLLVSRGELAVMNRQGLISADKDLTLAGKAIADIKLLIAERKRRLKKRNKPRAVERVTQEGPYALSGEDRRCACRCKREGA